MQGVAGQEWSGVLTFRLKTVARPYALIRRGTEYTLAEVVSIHSEGGGFISGPLTGYRCRPMNDDGTYKAPFDSTTPGEWIKPGNLFKDWAIRPSSDNLQKARARAKEDLFR